MVGVGKPEGAMGRSLLRRESWTTKRDCHQIGSWGCLVREQETFITLQILSQAFFNTYQLTPVPCSKMVPALLPTPISHFQSHCFPQVAGE